MDLELVPGRGMRLPGNAGTLSFGMTQREAAWAAASVADVRDRWICGASWAFGFALCDVAVSVSGGAAERLASVHVERIDPAVCGPAGVMVGYQDIDLFGHSFDEIQRALGLCDGSGTVAGNYYRDGLRGLVIHISHEPPPTARPMDIERPRYIAAAGVFDLASRALSAR